MGKNQSASGLTNIIQYDNAGNISFVSGSTTLLAISSSGAVTTTGVISGSDAANAISASYAQTATSASQAQSSNTAVSSSFATNAISASLLDGKDSTEFAITGSNIFTGTQYITNTINPNGFGASASIYTDGGLRVTKDTYISGTMFVNNLTVFGTQSINYVTSSQLNISTNIISVNTDTPSIRFGGLSVYDSGSTGLTGSMLWDSERDHWVYSNPSGSSYNSGMLISGPRNSGSLGTEQGTLNNYIVKGQGGDHVTSSLIIEDGTLTSIYSTMYVSSSGNVGIGITTPTAKLHVNGGYAGFQYNSGLGTYPAYDTYYSAIGHNFSNGGSEMDIWNTVGGGFVFRKQTASSTQTALLTIAASSDVYFLFAGNKRWGVDYDTTGAYFYGHATNSNARALRVISAAADANEGIYFQTGISFADVTTKMRITADGNVGINVSNPTYRLQVDGNTYLKGASSTSSDYSLVVQNSSATNLLLVRNDGPVTLASSLNTGGDINASTANIKLYSYQNSPGNYRYIGSEYAPGNGNNKAEVRFGIESDTYTYLAFSTANGGGTNTERMRITSGGKVGINNSSPNNVVDIYDQTYYSNTVGVLAARTRGAGTFITGRIVTAETSNQTLTIATCSASGGNERIFIKVQVVNTSAVSNYGNVHVGYALWIGSGGSTVTTMTLDTGNSSIGNANVGSLSWSGNNLQYTTNRAGNYELNAITIWGSARDTGVIS